MGDGMGGHGVRLIAKSSAWGAVAAIITVAAFFATLDGFSHLTGFQAGWIALAGLASMIFTSVSAFSAAKSATTIDQVDHTVSGLDSYAKDKTIALVAHIFSELSRMSRRIFDESDAFGAAIDEALETLHAAICRCHELDEKKIRVSLLMQAAPGAPGAADTDVNGVKVRCPSRSDHPEFNFADRELMDEFQIVMRRRRPYHRGWLWDGCGPSRPEYHILAPREREFSSYIRVGIPDLGVLCVESSDNAIPLAPADRELALAFADMLAIWRKAELLLALQTPAADFSLKNSEEANQQ
jgi:hypothetical protein